MDNKHHDDYNSQPDTSDRPYTPLPDVEVKYRRKRQPSTTSTWLITLLLLAVIGFIAFKIWDGGFSIKGAAGKYTVSAISNMDFNGVVTDFKYDDDRQHTKIAILSDGTRYSIYEPWVYDINTGDTLIKQKGKLLIEVRRPRKKKEILDYAPILRKLELTGRL
ncbi:MAG: hypothetical protein ABIN91_19745 [Mucilaginibacter sp.]|uniref:hypothetical protein n=1 Tax=Mucilaginibacter sp. TaxID=1882438 RepID=UPI003264AE4D